MNKIKSVLFMAGILLALAFTFSCSSGGDGDGFSSSSGAASKGGGSSSSALKECDAVFNPANKFCYDGTVYDKCDGMTYNPTSHICKNGVALPLGSFVEYAEQIYKTVAIGKQVWMAENLNYNAPDSKCYGNIEANCTTYGKLYDWATAMDIDAKYNSQLWGGSDVKHKGICPTGWHIPSEADWEALMTAVGGEMTLKATTWNGEDKYGFSALPGGRGYSSGSFYDVGVYGCWWGSSESGGGVYGWCIGDEYGYLVKGRLLFSVRCLQD